VLRVAAETTANAVAKRKKMELKWKQTNENLLRKYAKLREKFKKLGEAYTNKLNEAKQQSSPAEADA